jgi:hypothetical protein
MAMPKVSDLATDTRLRVYSECTTYEPQKHPAAGNIGGSLRVFVETIMPAYLCGEGHYCFGA